MPACYKGVSREKAVDGDGMVTNNKRINVPPLA